MEQLRGKYKIHRFHKLGFIKFCLTPYLLAFWVFLIYPFLPSNSVTFKYRATFGTFCRLHSLVAWGSGNGRDRVWDLYQLFLLGCTVQVIQYTDVGALCVVRGLYGIPHCQRVGLTYHFHSSWFFLVNLQVTDFIPGILFWFSYRGRCVHLR